MPKDNSCTFGKDMIADEEGQRYFLNPDSVSRHLYCSICQEAFVEPQRAPCGHSFCKKMENQRKLIYSPVKFFHQLYQSGIMQCILPWLSHSKTCPEDRKTLHPKQLHHDFILENIIGDQMVACSFRLSGCEFVGQLQQLASHQKKCDFNPKNVPDFILKTNSPTVQEEINFDEKVPSPGKPSLMMRLFRSGSGRKKLLQAMFDEKENSQ